MILLLVSSASPSFAQEDLPDTDEFHDADCKDAKNRLLQLAQELIQLGWTFLAFGANPSNPSVLQFMFAVDDWAIGDPGKYRSGNARYNKCDDKEINEGVTYKWNAETKNWEVEGHRSEMNIKTIAVGIVLALVVVGLLYLYIISGGSFNPIGGGGSCNPVKPVPTYNICG